MSTETFAHFQLRVYVQTIQYACTRISLNENGMFDNTTKQALATVGTEEQGDKQKLLKLAAQNIEWKRSNPITGNMDPQQLQIGYGNQPPGFNAANQQRAAYVLYILYIPYFFCVYRSSRVFLFVLAGQILKSYAVNLYAFHL